MLYSYKKKEKRWNTDVVHVQGKRNERTNEDVLVKEKKRTNKVLVQEKKEKRNSITRTVFKGT